MIAPLAAEILALSPSDRARLAAHLIDVGEVPELPLLILDTVLVDLMNRCIAREAAWREEAPH